MSFSAAHESKLARRACQICHHRKTRFPHVLCFECDRSERNRQRAQLLLQLGNPAFLRPLGPLCAPSKAEPLTGFIPLTSERISHRRRMLAHLEAARAGVVTRLG